MKTNRFCPSCHQALAPDAPEGLCPECLIRAGFATGEAPQDHTALDSTPAFNPPSVEELARLFPQLEINSLLGRGGMGAVYKVRQPALDRWTALKILPPSAGSKPGFMERFNREARALARLNHPGIVAVYEFGQASQMPYFVMEYVDGVNLRQLQKNGRVSPREALALIPQICDALQYAHDEGVVHRDIKPENVLVDRKGRVKIADFGIAKIAGTEGEATPLTQEKQVVGTPHYMAPEQIEHPQTVDHRADIFSLGVVFYELLTGELPLGKFSAPSKKVRLDVRLDHIVLRALEKEPELRYQQASQVKQDVQTVSTTPGPDPVKAHPQSASHPPPTETMAARRDLARSAPYSWQDLLRWPARLLMLVGLLNLAFMLFFRIQIEPAYPNHFDTWNLHQFLFISSAFHRALPPLSLFLLGVIILGAWRMRILRSYSLAAGAAVAAMFTPPFFFVGLPVGLWTLARLRHPDARAAFSQAESELGEPDRVATSLARVSHAVAWAGIILIVLLTCISSQFDYRVRIPVPPNRFEIILTFIVLPLVVAAVMAPLAAWLALDGLRRPSPARSLQQVVFVLVLAAMVSCATRWLSGFGGFGSVLTHGHRWFVAGLLGLSVAVALGVASWARHSHPRWWGQHGYLRKPLWWTATAVMCFALWPQPTAKNWGPNPAMTPTEPVLPFRQPMPANQIPQLQFQTFWFAHPSL